MATIYIYVVYHCKKWLIIRPRSGIVLPLKKPCCDGAHEPRRRVGVWHRAGLRSGVAGVDVAAGAPRG